MSFRRSDLELFRDSNLNGRLRDAQVGNDHQYCSYGDGIFPILSHSIGKHVGDTTAEQRYENRMMSKLELAMNGAMLLLQCYFLM